VARLDCYFEPPPLEHAHGGFAGDGWEVLGINRATVTLHGTNGNDETHIVITSSFGYFQLNNVLIGETYVLEVKAKGRIFSPMLLNVNDGISDLVITSTP